MAVLTGGVADPGGEHEIPDAAEHLHGCGG
jgi:hypothetical protein